MFNVPCGWSYWGERAIVPAVDSKEADMLKYVIRDRVWNNGTHGAYVSLAEKQTDIIIVARPPSTDEVALAREKGFEFDVRPISKDALVFVVNIQNPIDSLTVDQIKGIYRGAIVSWQQLGWEGNPVSAYQRDGNSGSQELFNTLVMKGTPMVEAPSMVLDTMSGPINAIHSDVYGIGYSVYYYSVFMLPDENVKLIGVNGVKPTAESIANNNYPLTTEVYVVMRTNGWGALAPELRDWLSTGEGQSVIRESGYVPLP
jgi:phosphate transport system substrate-binding protein